MSARITSAGLALMAAKAAAGQSFAIDKMVYAYIAGLDTSATPPLTEAMPAGGNIKLQASISAAGVAGSDTVVFSSVLGPDVGTWDFNWLGLYSSANNTLVAVSYVPSQTKRATAGATMGNSLTKNFAIQHTDIGTLTGVTISAGTWQQDFTSLLAGKANTSHTHEISQVNGLPDALAGKSPTNHTHEALVPPGAVMPFAQATPPAGWLSANGALVSRTGTYAALFAAIGITYGPGDGVSTFQLPDLRGEFIRGWDNGRSIDTGRALGSAQTDDFKSHSHLNGVADNPYASGTSGHVYGESSTDMPGLAEGYADTTGSSGTLKQGYTSATGGSETRPRNIALNYCIKY
ncbi:MAG: hypothetical protein RL095_3698 [Verrucomicrobiota bacterium]|jgi:microcystin-dependent protein